MVSNSVHGNTMKSDNTKEATLATLKLKDMLGIGGVGKSTDLVQGREKVLPNPAFNSNTTMAKETPKKKKKSKASNKSKAKKTKEHSSRQLKGSVTASSSTQQSSKQNKAVYKVGGAAPNQSKVKENDKRGRKSKNSVGGAKNNNALDGNYAWSAFQSPPDASTLPLPVFSNDTSRFSGGVVESESECSKIVEAEGLISSLSVSESIINEPRQIAEVAKSQAKSKQSVQALASEDHIKAILNIEQKPTVVRGTINSGGNGKSKQDIGILDQKEAPSTSQQPKNSSGVDLAVLASPLPTSSLSNDKPSIKKSSEKNSSFPIDARENQNERDPIAMLMNGQSYGTTNPTMTSSPHYSHYPVPQQSHTNSYQQQQMMMQHHAHVPQFITIQVQVPPVLLPGRQMMVSAGPGYSVPIVVPEGVHPGMVIPVTIPTHSPSPGQMGGPMSPVMMPHGGMMHMNVGSPSHQNFSHQEVSNGHQYPQPQFATPQRQIRRKGPEPGSWAARAAASPQNDVHQGKSVGNN